LQCVAVCCRVLQCHLSRPCPSATGMVGLQRVAVCCGVLWCVAVPLEPPVCSRSRYGCLLQCAAACCSVLLCVAMCCDVLQCRFCDHPEQPSTPCSAGVAVSCHHGAPHAATHCNTTVAVGCQTCVHIQCSENKWFRAASNTMQHNCCGKVVYVSHDICI